MRIGLDAHRHSVARLDHRDMLALGVHQIVCHRDRRFHQHFARPLAGALFLNRTQNLQRDIVVRADQPRAMAMRARLGGRFQHARAQTLTRHFHQAEARDPANLNAGAVGFQLVFHPLLDGGVILPLFHVDEVDDDQPREIAQAQLAGDFFRRFQVRLERGLLDGALFRRTARVHIDGDERLGDPDDDIAARFELHDRVEHRAEVAFHLEPRKERHLLFVVHHLVGMGRHDHAHEIFGQTVAALALDENLVDLFRVEIADRTLDQIAFLIDRRRRDRFEGQFTDLLPQAHQVFVVAADLGAGALRSGGADDQARALRHFHLRGDFFELLTIRRIGDLARNPAPARRVRHQDAVAPGKREIGGQRSAFVAALFFHNLHQHDLAHLDHFLDLVAARARFAGGANFFRDIIIRDGFDIVVLGGAARVLACLAGLFLVSLLVGLVLAGPVLVGLVLIRRVRPIAVLIRSLGGGFIFGCLLRDLCNRDVFRLGGDSVTGDSFRGSGVRRSGLGSLLCHRLLHCDGLNRNRICLNEGFCIALNRIALRIPINGHARNIFRADNRILILRALGAATAPTTAAIA